ncbi:MAG TPA: glycosyltransferase [bacterium]|nr:glycosyltransferase [bacterium]
MRDVLFLSYFFPPMGGGAVLRALKFVKYLPAFAWRPLVVAGAGGYHAYDASLLEELPAEAEVIWAGRGRDFEDGAEVARAFARRRPGFFAKAGRKAALTARRFFSFPDVYARFARPATRAARRLLQRSPVKLIFSTAPPFTSHVAAAALAREAGVPLILDYRDAWADNPFAAFPTAFHRRRARRAEGRVLEQAAAVVAVTSGMADAFRRRLGENVPARFVPNGYDEADFEGAEVAPAGPFTVAYAGQFYPGRMPWTFLRAASAFAAKRRLSGDDFRVLFLGPMPRAVRAGMDRYGVRVEATGLLSHGDAVRAVRAADVNLLIIGSQPGAGATLTGKIFEYLRAGRPILALVPPDGEAAALVEEFGAGAVVEPDDAQGAEAALARLYDGRSTAPGAVPAGLARFERRNLAAQLAALFDDVAGP